MQTPHFELVNGWKPAQNLRPEEVEETTLYETLIHTGSLTHYLQQLTASPTEVNLRQQSAMPSDEAPLQPLWPTALNLSAQTLLVRDAWLSSRGEIRVYAHSQIDWDHLDDEMRTRIRDGQVPLGGLFLAMGGKVYRDQLEVAQTHVSGLERVDQGALWCRRSLFTVDGKHIARILELFCSNVHVDPLD
uniref:Putative chorismate--pyruvate lyase UbiC n=1 Tax=Magnetococcus massalia (strain MO-1) TaxID=451514 RepID=A0A1S7LNV7_MAGMO|nr:putative chorismate--pyruvate lyase UbiC [Candidatus Magnetococcus massalia]